MNARGGIMLALRLLAVILFIQLIASLRLYDFTAEFPPIIFTFIVPGALMFLLIALSGRIARALAPEDSADGDAGTEDAGPATAYSMLPIIIALIGLLLVIKALGDIPAALTIVFTQLESKDAGAVFARHDLWLWRISPYLFLLVGIVLIAQARRLSSWWHTYTFGRFEE